MPVNMLITVEAAPGCLVQTLPVGGRHLAVGVPNKVSHTPWIARRIEVGDLIVVTNSVTSKSKSSANK